MLESSISGPFTSHSCFESILSFQDAAVVFTSRILLYVSFHFILFHLSWNLRRQRRRRRWRSCLPVDLCTFLITHTYFGCCYRARHETLDGMGSANQLEYYEPGRKLQQRIRLLLLHLRVTVHSLRYL